MEKRDGKLKSTIVFESRRYAGGVVTMTWVITGNDACHYDNVSSGATSRRV